MIRANRFVRDCRMCNKRIERGESYFQTPIDVDGGIALVGVHTDHFFNNPKDAANLTNKTKIQIEMICDTAVELVGAGASILESIERAKKIHGWNK